MEEKNPSIPFKVVLCGESSVGKSSLAIRFCKENFKENIESTIAAAFFQKVVETKNGIAKLDIWDTAGQENYKALVPMYYRGAHGACIVFDVTMRDSFLSVKTWLKGIKQAIPGDIVIALLANKIDLEGQRSVKAEESKHFANEHGMLHFETSALTGENVREIFENMAIKLLQLPRKVKKEDDDFDNERIIDTKMKSKKKCCK